MADHEALKDKLQKEFRRLNIENEEKKDEITTIIDRLAQFIIEAYGNK